MSSKYKPGDPANPHFVTFSVVGWIDVFTRERYKEIIIESLQYCQAKKGLSIHAWIIMSNHMHLIISSHNNKIEHIVRDFKKFTSKKIIQEMQNNSYESRKEWMLNIFNYAGSSNSNNKDFQFWKQDYHPVELDSQDKVQQRLKYLHDNPVRSGVVLEPWYFNHSSAIDYYANETGLLEIEHL